MSFLQRLLAVSAILLAVSCAVACKEEPEPLPVPEQPAVPAKQAPAEVAPAEAAPAAAVPVEQAAVAEFDAEQTFKTVCATCHGPGGAGDGPAGVALNPRPAAFNTAEFWATRDRAHIAKVIKEGGAAVGKSPMMVAFGSQYNDEQIGKLADHVMSFKPAG